MTNFRKRMRRSSFGKSKIILANDIEETKINKLEREILHNIKTLSKYLCAIKLNFHVILPLAEKNLSKINKAAHDEGLQTIADIKLNDIGSTNLAAIKRLWRCGFDAVIANPIMGPENLRELVKTSHKVDHGVITLVHMSHPGAHLGYGLSVRDLKSKRIQKLHNLFLKWSLDSGVDGIVVGATVPEIISYTRKVVKNRCEIYSPGVGTQGGDAEQALRAGSNYLIVGRTILNSKNSVAVAKKLQELSIKP